MKINTAGFTILAESRRAVIAILVASAVLLGMVAMHSMSMAQSSETMHIHSSTAKHSVTMPEGIRSAGVTQQPSLIPASTLPQEHDDLSQVAFALIVMCVMGFLVMILLVRRPGTSRVVLPKIGCATTTLSRYIGPTRTPSLIALSISRT